MRSFVAVPFAEDLKCAYRSLYDEGRAAYPRLRWVRPENLHLTIRFLGETATELVEPLRLEIEKALAPEVPFSFTIGPPGQFSGGRHPAPRILWFGLSAGRDSLERVARTVERAVRCCGFPRERRPWRPHLTVARNPGRSPQSVTAADWERLGRHCGLAGLSMKVENVALVESTLRPEGPLYSLVWEARLGASESRKNDDNSEQEH